MKISRSPTDRSKMITHLNGRFFILGIIISFLLMSCGVSEEAILKAVEETRIAGISDYDQSENQIMIVVVTATQVPDSRNESNNEAYKLTETPAPTLPPACLEDFSMVEVYGIGYLDNGNVLISFENVEVLAGNAYTLEVEQQSYECEILPKYPQRLYCNGPSPNTATEVEIYIHPAELNCRLFTSAVMIPILRVGSDGQGSGSSSSSNDSSPPVGTSPPVATSYP